MAICIYHPASQHRLDGCFSQGDLGVETLNKTWLRAVFALRLLGTGDFWGSLYICSHRNAWEVYRCFFSSHETSHLSSDSKDLIVQIHYLRLTWARKLSVLHVVLIIGFLGMIPANFLLVNLKDAQHEEEGSEARGEHSENDSSCAFET